MTSNDRTSQSRQPVATGVARNVEQQVFTELYRQGMQAGTEAGLDGRARYDYALEFAQRGGPPARPGPQSLASRATAAAASAPRALPPAQTAFRNPAHVHFLKEESSQPKYDSARVFESRRMAMRAWYLPEKQTPESKGR